MNRAGQTDHFTALDYTRRIEEYLGGKLDHIIYNNEHPSLKLLKNYVQEGETLVLPVHLRMSGISETNSSEAIRKGKKGDSIKRNLIRHNPDRLAKLIVKKVRLGN